MWCPSPASRGVGAHPGARRDRTRPSSQQLFRKARRLSHGVSPPRYRPCRLPASRASGAGPPCHQGNGGCVWGRSDRPVARDRRLWDSDQGMPLPTWPKGGRPSPRPTKDGVSLQRCRRSRSWSPERDGCAPGSWRLRRSRREDGAEGVFSGVHVESGLAWSLKARDGAASGRGGGAVADA